MGVERSEAGTALPGLGTFWGRRRVKGTSVYLARGRGLLPAGGGRGALGGGLCGMGMVLEQVILRRVEQVTDSDGNQAGQRPIR